MKNKYLGLDYSTQQLKALIIDTQELSCKEFYVNFDSELSQYKTKCGVYVNGDEICAPPLMWIEATDMIFEKMVKENINLFELKAISGSAQQHGSIYWKYGVEKVLNYLDSKHSLKDQLKVQLSHDLSPVWMDSSTHKECQKLREYFGGAMKYQEIFGYTLVERFTGPQIMKLSNNLDDTGHITLISNGMCSLFSGKISSIDQGEAAGTGLTICGSLEWNEDICSVISENIIKKLGSIVPSNSIDTNRISEYFVKRYGVNPDCKVITFTGDNISSLVGIDMKTSELGISLGTSDTMLNSFSKPPKPTEGIPVVTFPHPLSRFNFITLTCIKNGSQIRQKICNQYCNGNWDLFSSIFQETPPGNNGIIGLMNELQEITPPIKKGYYYAQLSNDNFKMLNEGQVTPPIIIRALIEGQILLKYWVFRKCCPDPIERFTNILVTGGASSNRDILQVIADVFNMPVKTIEICNSASLGAAYRAMIGSEDSCFEITKKFNNICETFEPKNHQPYKNIFDKFSKFIEYLQEI